MKMFKRLLCTIACVMTVFTLSGCSASFDAKEYVKGTLDNAYLGDSTLYQKHVDITEADAKKEYEEGIEIMIDSMFEELDLSNPSDDLRTKYEECFKSLYKKAKYDVEEAREVDGAYEVDVTVYPLTILSKTLEAMDDEVDQILENATDEELEDEEHLKTKIAEKMLDTLNKEIEAAEYTKPQTVTITVREESDGLYSFSDADFMKVDDLIISLE